MSPASKAVFGVSQAVSQAGATSIDQDRLAVEELLYRQILQAGTYSAQDSRLFAQWTAAFYASYAQRCATTAQALYQRYPLRVLPSPARTGRPVGRPVDPTTAEIAAAGSLLNQTAWHGSPHQGIQRFSTEHIGTGEGAQAFGWGLYFADQRELADHYRKKLAEARSYDPAYWDSIALPPDLTAAEYREMLELRTKVFANASKNGPNLTSEQSARFRELRDRENARIDAMEAARPKGQLYEVDIPEDDELLRWDEPLSEQSQHVKAGIELLFNNGALDDDTKRLIQSQGARWSMSGRKLYEALKTSDNLDNDGTGRAASLALADAGITGIKSLDGASRTAGQGSYNYVIFDGDDVRLQQTLSQTARDHIRERAAQGMRGSFRPSDLSIALHAGADHSTWIHEAGHFFLEVLSDLASQPNAPPEIVRDMQEVLAWMGIEGDSEQRAESQAESRAEPQPEAQPEAQPAAGAQRPPADAPRKGRSDLGFYSELATAIENLSTHNGSVQTWKQALAGLVNKGSVKRDEIEWSGLDDWLDLQQGKVSKDEIARYLEQGGVRVQETVLGSTGLHATGQLDVRQDSRGEWGVLDLGTDNFIGGTYTSESEALDALDQMRQDKPSKYQKYTLPGGDNYREVLLTLPQKAAVIDTTGWVAKVKRASSSINGKPEYEVFNAAGQSQSTVYGASSEQEAIQTIAQSQARFSVDIVNFHSSHWDQKNVLAHIRVNDRLDDQGKRVLFVEELQSDWSQQGRKSGFGGLDFKVVAPDPRDHGAKWEVLLRDRTLGWVHAKSHAEAVEQARLIFGDTELKETPAGPFVATTEGWVKLATKRLLVMAAEEGYDRLAFISGEQSADRYHMRYHLKAVRWARTSKGFSIGLRNDNTAGNYEDAGLHKATDLPRLLGLELATRIIQSPLSQGEELGLDVQVGGEAMSAFYDVIVHNTLKKLLPKVGGDTPREVTITSNPKGWHLTAPQRNIHGKWMLKSSDPNSQGVLFATKELAERALQDKLQRSVQLGCDVTPQMREQVAQGLPLFGQGPGQCSYPERLDQAKTLPGPASNQGGYAAPRGTRSALQAWQSMSLAQKRPFHERWAQAVEQYALEGRSPSAALQPVMERFAHWLRDLYGAAVRRLRRTEQAPEEATRATQAIQATRHETSQTQSSPGSELRPASSELAGRLDARLRAVLDRMLATDQELDQELNQELHAAQRASQAPIEAPIQAASGLRAWLDRAHPAQGKIDQVAEPEDAQEQPCELRQRLACR